MGSERKDQEVQGNEAEKPGRGERGRRLRALGLSSAEVREALRRPQREMRAAA